MNVDGKHYRTIWVKEDDVSIIQIIDQRYLPHKFVIEELKSVDDVVLAINEMQVRGAGLIGATAGYGIYIAALEAPKDDLFDRFVAEAGRKLKATRPTAVNLSWAVEKAIKEYKKRKIYTRENIHRVEDGKGNCRFGRRILQKNW